MNIKRGEVWLAALDPTIGSEIQKTRPVIVVSNDINNANNSVVSVIPITSNVTRILSFEVFIPAGVASLTKDSKAKTDQIRTLDKSRLVKRYGALPAVYTQQLNTALKLHLALP
ncbi:type II toxin-antitoxin system PemK/MazF family toxin [Spirosoma sp. KCTC 42546]|uniref:type II toxin-antitoxin system PemK/MazF family toxin n=1 Tax=Spirosoma sp. KCTC 42546 TaxID=2520506 RepID=UPI001159AB5D|nr:type II toxin-antitoxin system PemK/MazF family toxin [Spirosoma sp. KCTC 42546]QDK79442.1 type II toxin-antitoxin system PemK/MazF family toxin [Spirosoma sp. KCTC 42546]